MKHSMMLMSVMIVAALSSCAQTKHEQKSNTKIVSAKTFDNTNAEVKTQINNVLSAYYNVKDALVADDEAAASKAAKA